MLQYSNHLYEYFRSDFDAPADALPVIRSNGHKGMSQTQNGAPPVHSSPVASTSAPNGAHSALERNSSSKPSTTHLNSAQNSMNGQKSSVKEQQNSVNSSRATSGNAAERERIHSASVREQQTVVPLLGTTQPLLSRLGASANSSNGALDIYVSYPDRCIIVT